MRWHTNRYHVGQVLKGIAVSAINMLVSVVAVTLCIENEYYEMEKCKYIAPVIWAVSSYLGAYIAGRGEADAAIIIQLLTCVIVYLSLLAFSLFTYDELNWTSAGVVLLACAMGGSAAIFVQNKQGKRTRTRKRRHPSR